MTAEPDRVVADFRTRIDSANAAILAALESRASLVRELVAYKRAKGLPIVDEAREREMLARVSAAAGAGMPRDAVERIFTAIFAESRRSLR